MYETILKDFESYIILEKNLSKNTKLSYSRDVKKFLEYCDTKNINFLTANHKTLEEYLFFLKEKKYTTSSLFRKTEAIKSFYRFLLIDGRIKENKFSSFKAPRIDRKLPDFLSVEDINKLLSLMNGRKLNILRTFVIIELLYSSGIRVSEASSLVIESLNLDQLWIRVTGKGSKERIVPINEDTRMLIKLYLDERQLHFEGRETDPYLFLNKSGKKISRVQIWKDIKKVAKQAGIKKNIYPHIFRHTFATHLLNGGADLKSISEMLGHSSLTTTQIYTHLDNSAIKSMHKKYHPEG